MSKKVLVVDDSPTEALRARLLLERAGYQVSLASDGQEGLSKAAAEKPDLIVLDTIMPRMSGYEAYQCLKVDPQTAEIPILMLMTNNGATSEPRPLGVDTYIAKPYAPNLLLDGVQTATQPRQEGRGYSDDFMAIMSHELRTPLHELVGMTDLLLNTKLTAEQRGYVNTAKISISALMAMVSDLLEFSEMKAGELALEETAFDLWEVVENTAKTMVARAQEKGLKLVWRLASDVPRMVVGDPRRLRQVVSNLLGNAVKFTEKGKIGIEVKVNADETEQVELHFLVHDSGVGIPPDKQQLIFEAFQQSDASHTRHYGGIGLGLAVAQRLVALMDGRIWVESSGVPGEGSAFHFALSFQRCREAEQPPVAAPTRPEEKPQLHILVAEDSPTNQLIAVANLKKAGHTVHVAENGRLAVAALATGNFDLILMDIAMPEMDGMEATRAIREQEKGNGRHIPIIAMTAFAMKGYREKCLEAGMDSYVSKPVSADKLHEAIEPFLERVLENRQAVGEDSPVPPVDLEKALGVVDNDLDILEVVVEMLPQEYPGLVQAIGEALAQSDASVVEAAAHKLKAVLGNVGSGPAFDLAGRLEAMGIEGELEGGTAVLTELKREIERVATFYAQPGWMQEAAKLLGDD